MTKLPSPHWNTLPVRGLIGIGNALADVICEITETDLAALGLAKGTMTLSDVHLHNRIADRVQVVEVMSGGSLGNSMWNTAKLGGQASFVGTVANDKFGDSFVDDMVSAGVQPLVARAAEGWTGCCMVLITPDGERTMATNLGTAGALTAEPLHNLGREAGELAFAIESYLFDSPPACAVLEELLDSAAMLVISLSDPFCVERHAERISQLVAQRASIVVGNWDEAVALARVAGRGEAEVTPWLEEQSTGRGDGTLFVITRSADPVLIFQNGQCTEVTVPPLAGKLVDTTGAGDAFLAGLLYGLMQGEQPASAARRGNALAAATVQVIGPRLQHS